MAPSASAPPTRPLFIVGCARSGTTLLQLMLHAHPRIAIPPETRFLVELYDRRLEFGDPRDPATRAAIADEIVSGHRFSRLGIEPETVRQRIVASPPTLGSMFAVVFEVFAARFGATRWGDKRPNYIRRLPVLLKLFPDAQIIHIVRDGRACVASLKRMPWWQHGVPAAAEKWVDAMQKADDARRGLRADQYHELRYEDLIADPERVLRHLCAFIDEDFEGSMLSPQEVADIIPDRRRWHRMTHQPITDRAVQRWEDDLTSGEVQLVEASAGRYLRRWGYELSEGVRPLPPVKGARQYARAAYERSMNDRRWAVREALTARQYDHPVARATEEDPSPGASPDRSVPA